MKWLESNKVRKIMFEQDGVKKFIDPSEVQQATYGDYFATGYGPDDLGLTKVGETDEGEPLYEGVDFDGQKTREELEDVETEGQVIRYWDGNNHQVHIYREDELNNVVTVDIEPLDPPSPAYYFPYRVTLPTGEEIICYESNISGHISPYLIEDLNTENEMD